jgi:hypothetical protein
MIEIFRLSQKDFANNSNRNFGVNLLSLYIPVGKVCFLLPSIASELLTAPKLPPRKFE